MGETAVELSDEQASAKAEHPLQSGKRGQRIMVEHSRDEDGALERIVHDGLPLGGSRIIPWPVFTVPTCVNCLGDFLLDQFLQDLTHPGPYLLLERIKPLTSLQKIRLSHRTVSHNVVFSTLTL
jgi:hypothetical protein